MFRSHRSSSRSPHRSETRKLAMPSLRAALGAIASLSFVFGSAAAAPPDTTSIWRLQVRFITADVGDAGTDSTVWVQLNDGNKTYLDSGRDDRERGKDETYDLRLDGVNTLADIDFFRTQKNGDDGWAIRRMILIVNNVAIFDESFASPLWLDNEGGASRIRFVDDMFMRPRSQWANYVVPTRPSIVPVGDMNSRVESLHGDHTTSEVSNLGLKEVGHNAASLNAISLDTWGVHVSLDEVDTWLIGQDINLDFNLKIGCVSGRPNFTVSNVNASSVFEPYTEESRHNAKSFVNGDFKPRLNEMMKGFRSVPFCPTIALSPDGDIHFGSRFPIGDFSNLTFATLALVDLNVQTGDGIKTFAQANFVATVMSRLKGNSKAELNFELPAQIAAYDTIVEVRRVPIRGAETPKEPTARIKRSELSKGEYRTINAKLKQRGDGTSLLAFVDELAAGQNVEYTMHLVYQPKDDGSGQIVTTIQQLGEEYQKLVTPLKS
ncbi:MAG TPA: hypothetical protein VK629_10505, partial [Steroidobacteraceae bacterium]|nr:hypothetical protein [Steroidobacteraceae bacterium]